jgi:hypothetical protein
VRAIKLIAAGAAVAALGVGAAPALAADRLPDLRMKRMSDIHIEQVNGVKALKYTTIVVNAGVGPFEAFGQRPTNAGDMDVWQDIYQTGGGFRRVPTDANMFFAGDGHNHWHIRALDAVFLQPVDFTAAQRRSSKVGFCMYDSYKWNTSLPNSPAVAHYTGCGGDPNRLKVTMGLSVGWGDRYPSTLPTQYISLQGWPDGRYRLRGVADPQTDFIESNEGNNTTVTTIRITGNTVTILSVTGGV